MNETIVINGRITEGGCVPPDDRGFLLGDGLFETIPLYDGAPFFLDLHFERIARAAREIGMEPPFDLDDIAGAIARLASANAVSRGVARLTLTRGSGPRGYGVKGCDAPFWLLACRPFEPMTDEKRVAGFRLMVASITKNPASPITRLKATSSLDRVMMAREAAEDGADEALAMTTDGHVSSCAAANIFWISGGRLFTPSLECAILPGVTRRIVTGLANDEKINIAEGRFGPDALRKADEVFITNSLMEVVPVTHVDGLFSSASPGPVTLRLAAKYKESTGVRKGSG